jgi:hypothetical protein
MIKQLVNLFIGWKIYQLFISIILLIVAYNIFPQPFHFIFNILRNIK